MKSRSRIVVGLGIMAIHLSARGAIIFSQNFSGSTDVSTYVNSTQPDSGQWNSINGGAIASGALSFTRNSSGGNIESFTRSTDFNPAPQALIYTFNLGVGSTTVKTTAAAVLQVGAGFTLTLNNVEPNANVNSQFAINFTDSHGGFTFRNLDTKTDYTQMSFSGAPKITWVINESGAPFEYQAPDGSTQSVGNHQWDLWAGSYPIFDNRTATTPGEPLTDLKFAFAQGAGTISLDNFNIQSVPAVPEPEMTGAFAGAFLVLLALLRTFRRSRVRENVAVGIQT